MKVIINTIIPFRGFLAITLWPFIFVRRAAAARFTEVASRHEHIHGRQQLESLSCPSSSGMASNGSSGSSACATVTAPTAPLASRPKPMPTRPTPTTSVADGPTPGSATSEHSVIFHFSLFTFNFSLMKTLSLSELRRVAERTRLVKRPANGQWTMDNGQWTMDNGQLSSRQPNCPLSIVNSQFTEVAERVPWKVWYVAAGNGDCILGEECVTLAVDVDGPGAYPSRLVQFTASGQTRRLRDCCILRADDFLLRV